MVITDGFPGPALDIAWTVTLDTPTVDGELHLATGGAGLTQMVHSTSLMGDNVQVSVVMDLDGVSAGFTIIGLGSGTGAYYWPGVYGLHIMSGANNDGDAGLSGLTGRFILTLTQDVLNATATIASESDPDTILYSVSCATDAAEVTNLAAGEPPTLILGASDTQSWDDFYASDEVDPGPAPAPAAITGSGMIFSITTLHYPAHDEVDEALPIRVARLVQFEDGEVGVPANDMRDARVTLSVYDPACQFVKPLEYMLHVRYLGQVVFWGAMTDPEWDITAGKVTINALGPEYRTQKHFVREGDEINGAIVGDSSTDPDGTKGVDCPITSDGMWDIVLTAYNTTAQNDRGVPDVGILRGLTGDSGSTEAIKVSRGDETFSTIQQLQQALLGPDFEFEPLDMTDVGYVGGYAVINTYEKQGTDKTATIRLQYNWGKSNLDGYTERPSGTSVVTHAHRLSANGKNRGTAAAGESSARFGVYVDWDTIDGNPTGADNDAKNAVLAGFGKITVRDYGEPPPFIDVTLKPVVDGQPALRYGLDYGVGDEVNVSAHKGFYRSSWDARITKVTLKQTNSQRSTLPSIELVPSILTDDDVSSTED